MSLFFKRFSELCREENTSPNAVAKKLGISSGSITAWKKGTEPRTETLLKLADFFHVTADYLSGNVNDPSFYVDNERTIRGLNSYEGEDNAFGPSANILVSVSEAKLIKKYRDLDDHGRETVDWIVERERLRTEQLRRRPYPDNVIPLLRSLQPVSAGVGVYLGPEEMETIWVTENELTDRAAFCVPVSGDSMEPLYSDGDLLLVEGCKDIPVGQIGVFTVEGDGYVKRRGEEELISLNPAYGPVPLTEDSWCNGLVIGVMDPEWIM